IRWVKIITEIVAAMIQTNEKRPQQKRIINDETGPIEPSRLDPDPPVNKDRSKEQAPITERVVPVALHKDVTRRRPHVTRRNPHPTRTTPDPDPRTQKVVRLPIDPTTRYENTLSRWRSGNRLGNRVGGRRQKIHFLLILRLPKSRHPLP